MKVKGGHLETEWVPISPSLCRGVGHESMERVAAAYQDFYRLTGDARAAAQLAIAALREDRSHETEDHLDEWVPRLLEALRTDHPLFSEGGLVAALNRIADLIQAADPAERRAAQMRGIMGVADEYQDQ